MADLSFIYDKTRGFCDLKIAYGDFVVGDELLTSVLISLFTDRRATTDEIRRFNAATDGRVSKRGYWANLYREYVQGSALWLLSREKKTEETLSRAKRYALESLAWLTKEGVAETVAIETSWLNEALILNVKIKKPDGQEDGFRFQFAWDSLEIS